MMCRKVYQTARMSLRLLQQQMSLYLKDRRQNVLGFLRTDGGIFLMAHFIQWNK